jgi:hypothetical protein
MTEQTLSDKIEHSYDAYCGTGTDLIHPEDVKDFIKKLKEKLNNANKEDVVYEFDEIINKLAGDKLI